MQIPIYHIDAFTNKLFSGNPAAVCIVDLQSRIELLQVQRAGDVITLNFPTKNIDTCHLPLLEEGLRAKPVETYQHKTERLLAVYNTEEEIKQLNPDMQILKKLEHRGITVTAKSKTVDFVSRTFYPHKNISEDPVTGASHCLLIPYWQQKLNKTKFHAKQISARGGEMFCEYQNDRVLISSKCIMYSQGILYVF